MALTVHFQGARRSPHHGPLNFVERRSHVGDRRQQNVGFDVKQARSFVRALDQTDQAVEMPPSPMQRHRVRDAVEQLAGFLDLVEEL